MAPLLSERLCPTPVAEGLGYFRACLARLLWELSRSQPDVGIEFLNSDLSPHILQTPWLVGPLGLSMIQWCWHSDTSSSSLVTTGPLRLACMRTAEPFFYCPRLSKGTYSRSSGPV